MAAPYFPDGKISGKRIGLLNVARKQLGLDEDSWRDILRRWGKVDSAKDLGPVGFETVMIRLEQLGFRSTWTKRTFGDRAGMATPAQINLIRELWKEFCVQGDADDRHLNAWLEKFHNVSALRFVSAAKASKVIPALKKMVSRRGGGIA